MALREFDFEKEPTVSVVKKILSDAIRMKATDIHFDPTPDELVIKFRINGDLNEYTIAPDNVKINILTRIKILAGMNITNSLIPQTGAISFELDNKPHNMRVSSLPIIDGEKIVVHLSTYAQNLKNISKLGFSDENVKKIKNLIREKQGIILITGTTNSGKTTTTYSILKEINNKANNVISIEDPIKMKIKGINQVCIAPEKGLTYRNILKNVLLQDPNIIAINELVDDETARSALRASLTGRLVISTMYTKSAFETIDHLLNMDIENYLLGSNLLGVISQRMVKKLCPTCREKKKANEYEQRIIKAILGEDIDELYYPNGCEECRDGYIDQIPIEETVIIDDELRSAISNNKNRSLIREIIYSENKSIIKNGLTKAIAGETSFEEILRVMDLNVDFTDEDKELKNFILGNETVTVNAETKRTNKKEEAHKVEENTEKAIKEKTEIPKEENEEKEEKDIVSSTYKKVKVENKKTTSEEEKEPQEEKEEPKITKEKKESKQEIEVTPIQPPKEEKHEIEPPVKEKTVKEEAVKKEQNNETATQEKQLEEKQQEEKENMDSNPPIVITTETSEEDDDDDDNFSYDDSYINHF